MLNRDIYQKDPSTRKLVNEGVASVNDEKTNQALSVLRYELETFVCDGQYEKGLEHILDVYLKNIEQAEQPAVWVSGFYGSGKSHLVKMLRALWVDSQFEDGASRRFTGRAGQRYRLADCIGGGQHVRLRTPQCLHRRCQPRVERDGFGQGRAVALRDFEQRGIGAVELLLRGDCQPQNSNRRCSINCARSCEPRICSATCCRRRSSSIRPWMKPRSLWP